MKQKVGGQQKLVGDESVFVDLNRGGRGCFFIRKKKNCLEKLIQISEFWSRYFFANAKAAPITPRIRPTKLITPKVKMLRRENTSTIIPHVFSFPGVYLKTAPTMIKTPKTMEIALISSSLPRFPMKRVQYVKTASVGQHVRYTSQKQ